MRLLLSDTDIDLTGKEYLIYNIGTYDIMQSFNYITKSLLSSDIIDVVFLTPFMDMSALYSLAQLFYNVHICNVYKAIYSDGNITNVESIWKDKPILEYLEYEVTSKCNLKCKGCSHFSYLDESDDFTYDYDKDMKCLSQKYSQISKIRLLGGEPLLALNLGDYILSTRKYFPDSNIEIVTNGLLLKNLPNDLVTIIHDLKVNIEVSLYPQFYHLKDSIIDWAERNNLGYVIFDSFKFSRFLSTQNNNHIQMIHDHCNCHMLKGGKISKCPFPLSIHRLNNKFGTDYPTDDYLDIYSVESAWEINKYLALRMKMCNYCLQNPKKFVCKQIKNVQSISLYDWVKQEEAETS